MNFSPFEELTSDAVRKADFINELLGREEALLRCSQVAQQPEEHSHLSSQMTLTLTQGKNRFVLPLKVSIVCDKEKMCLYIFPLKKKSCASSLRNSSIHYHVNDCRTRPVTAPVCDLK